ncbi:DNA-binding protein HU [Fusobacterium gonidiaformans 3-1-5R]|uniref:DNA-binding protein HU n=2 Tax=Fusobacterium TaxID=848 RepID=E5BFY7_9FUSO|nr:MULTISPECIES: HU family DNA-binding protein [Fusobacterium]AVQ17131.1 HU family DNA-binding protein [Fusobacterium gonidiaformans ATCC 25563]EFS21018.1 DNA-binding protein HU [Fusobacterium gonidiaformans 3-1-5R]EFS29076.1 hypothetical protein FGAG_01397 [Fusobacterium gonidiaformans ATCC 25563]KXA16124.1 putative DNA-binding protein HU [Fusobacterium equinum]
MTKKEFVAALAKKAEVTGKEADKMVKCFLELVEESLVAGNDVKFIGFGSWETKKREARKLRNPQTGKEMKIAAKRVVKFKVGKALADKVAAKK